MTKISMSGSTNCAFNDCSFGGDEEDSGVRGDDFLTVLGSDITLSLRDARYSVALASALTIPDICSKLERREIRGVKPNKIKRARYEKWFDDYVATQYPSRGWPPRPNEIVPEKDWPPTPGVSGADAYALRNAVVHGADFETPNHSSRPYLNGFTFFAPSLGSYIHRGYNYELRRAYLNVKGFCEDIISGLIAWEGDVKDCADVQQRRNAIGNLLHVETPDEQS